MYKQENEVQNFTNMSKCAQIYDTLGCGVVKHIKVLKQEFINVRICIYTVRPKNSVNKINIKKEVSK